MPRLSRPIALTALCLAAVLTVAGGCRKDVHEARLPLGAPAAVR